VVGPGLDEAGEETSELGSLVIGETGEGGFDGGSAMRDGRGQHRAAGIGDDEDAPAGIIGVDLTPHVAGGDRGLREPAGAGLVDADRLGELADRLGSVRREGRDEAERGAAADAAEAAGRTEAGRRPEAAMGAEAAVGPEAAVRAEPAVRSERVTILRRFGFVRVVVMPIRPAPGPATRPGMMRAAFGAEGAAAPGGTWVAWPAGCSWSAWSWPAAPSAECVERRLDGVDRVRI
jgi:hypothetical protein